MDEILPPADASPNSLAEYIEAILLVEDIDHLSQSELRVRFPSGQQPSSQEISFALAEIEGRARLAGECYPCTIEDSGVRKVANAGTPVYDFMTILSLDNTPMRTDADYGEADRLFDAVVTDTAKRAIYGDSALSVYFGWPPRGGRPSSFVEAVTWLGAQMGIPDGVTDRPPDEKDAGVDVVVWRPYGDRRTGFMVTLVQNTIKVDYAAKPKDVVPGSWTQWLRLGTAPSVGFAIPFAVPHGDDRRAKIGLSADVILDRFRIMGHLTEEQAQSLPEIADIARFNTAQVEAIRTSGGDGPTVRRPRKQAKSEHRDESVR